MAVFGNNVFGGAGPAITGFGGAVSDLLTSSASATGTRASALGTRIRAYGTRVEADNYDRAAVLADQNEQFTEQSTAIKLVQQDRETALGLGRTEADIAGAGFSESGSALDILRSGAQQGALAHQVLNQQGLITEAGYTEQADSYRALSAAGRWAAGQEDIQAQMQDKAADKTEMAGKIGAAFKVAGAVASFALAPATGGASLALSAATLGTLNATDPGDI